MHFFLLVLFVLIYRILVEVILGIEVPPNNESKKYSFFNPTHERTPYISCTDVIVQSEETAKSESPFNRGKSVGVSEDILPLKIVELLDGKSIILFLAHINKNLIKINLTDECLEAVVQKYYLFKV